jgi:hypothetical protein
MSESGLLDEFGRVLITEVRDRAIVRVLSILGGTLQRPGAQVLHEQLRSLSSDERNAVEMLSIEAVDSTLHRLLLLLEESNLMDCRLATNAQSVSLKDASDGLAGELYSDAGWIARFSSQGQREG